jgi:hypothetical protein
MFCPKLKFHIFYLFIYLFIYLYLYTIKGGPKGNKHPCASILGSGQFSKNICDGPITVQNFGCNPPPTTYLIETPIGPDI